MRRGLSLIELIFTIVIIALVFTVIPKVILSLNKSDKLVIRQDALFNGISMVHLISNLAWDQNNTNSNDILHVSSNANPNLDCSNSSHYRIGGFIGSRNCEDNLLASSISSDGASDYTQFNDVDDFNGTDINASYYGLHVEVNYIDDNITYIGNRAVISLKQNPKTYTTNLKFVDLNITYQGKRGKKGGQISQFSYTSSNIGQITLNKRVWQ